MYLQENRKYRIKKKIFHHEPGEEWILIRQGYERYYGVMHYEFHIPCRSSDSDTISNGQQFNLELHDDNEEDLYIRSHIDEYFEVSI